MNMSVACDYYIFTAQAFRLKSNSSPLNIYFQVLLGILYNVLLYDEFKLSFLIWFQLSNIIIEIIHVDMGPNVFILIKNRENCLPIFQYIFSLLKKVWSEFLTQYYNMFSRYTCIGYFSFRDNYNSIYRKMWFE